MKFYLKWVNPIVAIMIFIICTSLYFGRYFVNFNPKEVSLHAKGENIIDPAQMGLPMYFFAKGLFCSSILFLFGEFLKSKIVNKNK